MAIAHSAAVTGPAATIAARLSALAAGAEPALRQETEFCILRGAPVVFCDGTFDLDKFFAISGVRELAPWFMKLDTATGAVEMLYQRPSGLFLSRVSPLAKGDDMAIQAIALKAGQSEPDSETLLYVSRAAYWTALNFSAYRLARRHVGAAFVAYDGQEGVTVYGWN